jgi:ABC-type sugar transport system substrate-binding protein
LRNWVRILVATVFSLATAPAAWCGDIKVGFIDPQDPPAFWNLVDATMRAAAVELGIDVEIRSMERSRAKAITVARDLLGESPPLDYLIVCNNWTSAAKSSKWPMPRR